MGTCRSRRRLPSAAHIYTHTRCRTRQPPQSVRTCRPIPCPRGARSPVIVGEASMLDGCGSSLWSGDDGEALLLKIVATFAAMLHRVVSRLATRCGPSLPLPHSVLAVGARAARSATRKKNDRSVIQRLNRMDSQSGGEDEGFFKGKITGLMGSFMQVRCTPSLFRPPNRLAACGIGRLGFCASIKELSSPSQVTLHDGRVVKAKPAGKLTRPGHFQTLKVGLGVTVQYSLDEDEDAQTPMIISREIAERVAAA